MTALDQLRETMRRDRVFDFIAEERYPFGQGRRTIIPGAVDVSHGPILYLENVNVSFDGFKALNKLTLHINDGELRCIIGPNGAGKTTLARGFLHGIGYEGPVKSPTYTLVEPYPIDALTVYHLDLYRLADPEELEYIGMRDILTGESICLVAWPEKGDGRLPAPEMSVSIAYAADMTEGRDVEIRAVSPKGEVLLGQLKSSN